MKVMPAETRNSQDAYVMPSIRMIGRMFMRWGRHPEVRASKASEPRRMRPDRGCHPSRLGALRRAPQGDGSSFVACDEIRRPLAQGGMPHPPQAHSLFAGRPAFYPLDSLFALRRDDIGGGKNAEVIEDRVAKLGIVATRGHSPHRLVHRLVVLAHENMAARCVEREAFHRLADLFISRPGAILYLDGLFDRRLQPIKRLRHEISGIVGKRVELLLVALHVVPVRRVCLGIRMLEM